MPMDVFNFIKLGSILGVRFEKAGAVFSSVNKDSFLHSKVAQGIFKHIQPSELDVLVIRKAYDQQEVLGIPDGMSQQPENINDYHWKQLQLFGSPMTTQDNYFIPTKKLIDLYKEMAVGVIAKWRDYFKKDAKQFLRILTTIENHVELMTHLVENIPEIYTILEECYATVIKHHLPQDDTEVSLPDKLK